MGRFNPIIEALVAKQRRELSPFRVGDTLKVHYRITEGDKERIQIFQGTVIRKSGGGIGETFCVRKRSAGVGVERIFPLHSPNVDKVEVITSGKVRRSKLFYLRELAGKAARLKERDTQREEATEA